MYIDIYVYLHLYEYLYVYTHASIHVCIYICTYATLPPCLAKPEFYPRSSAQAGGAALGQPRGPGAPCLAAAGRRNRRPARRSLAGS